MFYYLFYNSSFSFIVDNRLFSTILYGSILYIITHAILNYCGIDILTIIYNYYWYIFILDIISLSYGIYLSLSHQSSHQSSLHSQQNVFNANYTGNTNNTDNQLEVSFNLLKNKMNTIGNYFKNDLTITDPTNSQQTSYQANNPTNNSAYYQQNKPSNQLHTNITKIKQTENDNKNDNRNNSMSTPLSQLNNKVINSTPLSLLRNNNLNDISSEQSQHVDTSYAESNTGSDLGSIMDLDDFEKSL